METNRTKIFVAIIFSAVLAVGAAACTRQAPGTEPAPELPADEPQAIETEPLSKETVEQLDWQEYKDERFSFRYPAEWLISVAKAETGKRPSYVIRLQDTAKKISLGGTAPDDYFMPGTKEINTAVYADEYYLLTVEVYEGFGDWQKFFADVYGDVVAEQKPYELPTRPELSAVSASKVTGLISGNPRFFVQKGGAVFDCAIYYSAWDKNQALKITNTFLKDFSF